MSTPLWILMPVLDCWNFTQQAIQDCLDQSVPTRLLVINNGSSDETRHNLEKLQESHEQDGRVLVWHHDPPLPSLSATWNRALDFVWDVGGEEALVVNNDVRLHPQTCEFLQVTRIREPALFVSAMGVREVQFAALPKRFSAMEAGTLMQQKGGPDFSCFLITKALHATGVPSLGGATALGYRFDESLIPCYTEDLDYHRRLMLAGLGQRIFSINLPFLHYASQTINRSPEAQAAFHAKARQVRAIYARKWGGPPNEEIWERPYGGTPGSITYKLKPKRDVTTPALFEQERRQWTTTAVETLIQEVDTPVLRSREVFHVTERMGRVLDQLAESVETAGSPFAKLALGVSRPSPTDSGPRSASSSVTAPPTSPSAGSGPGTKPAGLSETVRESVETHGPMDDELG